MLRTPGQRKAKDGARRKAQTGVTGRGVRISVKPLVCLGSDEIGTCLKKWSIGEPVPSRGSALLEESFLWSLQERGRKLTQFIIAGVCTKIQCGVCEIQEAPWPRQEESCVLNSHVREFSKRKPTGFPIHSQLETRQEIWLYVMNFLPHFLVSEHFAWRVPFLVAPSDPPAF